MRCGQAVEGGRQGGGRHRHVMYLAAPFDRSVCPGSNLAGRGARGKQKKVMGERNQVTSFSIGVRRQLRVQQEEAIGFLWRRDSMLMGETEC